MAQVDCPAQAITAHTAAQRPTEEERTPSGVSDEKGTLCSLPLGPLLNVVRTDLEVEVI